MKTYDTFGASRRRSKRSWCRSVPRTLQRRLRTVTRQVTLFCFGGTQMYLASPYTGPFEVIRHLVMGNIKVLHVTRLKLFVGSREEAYKAALLDADQFVIRKIHYLSLIHI